MSILIIFVTKRFYHTIFSVTYLLNDPLHYTERNPITPKKIPLLCLSLLCFALLCFTLLLQNDRSPRPGDTCRCFWNRFWRNQTYSRWHRFQVTAIMLTRYNWCICVQHHFQLLQNEASLLQNGAAFDEILLLQNEAKIITKRGSSIFYLFFSYYKTRQVLLQNAAAF